MDVSSFYELKNRLYSSAAAGCGSISEDFRLKRAFENFEPLSKANKAFGKLYDLCDSLLKSENPETELPDCIALADALAVTQGTYKDGSETEKALKTGTTAADIPNSELEELCSGIRKNGSKILKLPKEKSGCLKDPRILSVVLDNLENGKETPEYKFFMEMVCRICGDPLADMLKASVKSSGKQIKYVRKLRGDNENAWYLSLIENTENSENVRKEAVAALSCSESNTEKLIELYNTEKGKVKSEALLALARLSSPEAEPIFKKLCEKYKSGNLKYISESHGEGCTKFAVQRFTEILENCKANKGKKKELKKALDKFADEWELLANKTDESVDDIIISLCENDDLALPVYNYTAWFAPRINDALIMGLRDGLFEETSAQIERLYARKPECFQAIKTFVDFIKNPEKKISFNCDYHGIICTLLKIEYVPLLEKYVVGWLDFNDVGLGERLPLLIIGDSFPQSVIDFCTDVSADIISDLQKLEDGLSDDFDALIEKIHLPRISVIAKYGSDLNKALASAGYYIMLILAVLNPERYVENYAEKDSGRIISAGLDLAVKSLSVGAFSTARVYILDHFKGSDEELIKLNTQYVMNALKYYDLVVSPNILVCCRSAETEKAALEALEKELPNIEKIIDDKILNKFKAEIAQAWKSPI